MRCMNAHGGIDVYLHSFLIWALYRSESSELCSDHFIPYKTPAPIENEAGWAPEAVWALLRGEGYVACAWNRDLHPASRHSVRRVSQDRNVWWETFVASRTRTGKWTLRVVREKGACVLHTSLSVLQVGVFWRISLWAQWLPGIQCIPIATTGPAKMWPADRMRPSRIVAWIFPVILFVSII
jgi:hypothetical protein